MDLMKDRVRTRAFVAGLDGARHSVDPSVAELGYWFKFWDERDIAFPADPKSWEFGRRVVAFLESDLHLPEVREQLARQGRPLGPRTWWFARRAAVFATAGTPAVVWGWEPWITGAVWAVMGVELWLRMVTGRRNRTPQEVEAKAFEPFANREEWLAHEPLIKKLGLHAALPDAGTEPTAEGNTWVASDGSSVAGELLLLPPTIALLPFLLPLGMLWEAFRDRR